MTLRHLLTAVAIVGLAGAAPRAQSPDPMLGTWKLNVEKSKSPYTSGTSVIEAAGDGVKVTADMVGADGTAYHWTWTAKYDGKDVPVTGKTPYGDNGTVALTRVDANTVKIVSKIGGKTTLNQTITTSADGKTRTVTTKGVDAKGQPIETNTVYDKQ